MALADDLIERSVLETFEAMFEALPERLDAPVPHAERQAFLTATVQIQGDWNGAVLMDFEPELARSLTALALEREHVLIDDMRDALGEVVNIVGGYIKQALPPHSSLSLPTLATGVDYRLFTPGARPIHRLAWSCPDGRFQVTVYEVADASASAASPPTDPFSP